MYLPLRPSPRSTLFPYTTLFRSSGFRAQLERRQSARRRDPKCVATLGIRMAHAGETGATHNRIPKVATHFGSRRDRKSTRLNSSHSQISYAVFCLKKKKKKQTTM